MLAALVAEVVPTAFFLIVILGSTSKKAPAGFAPIAIGLCLTLIHLIGIPVTNLSVNPARSTGPALFVGGWALAQLWLFWVALLLGAGVGAFIYNWLDSDQLAIIGPWPINRISPWTNGISSVRFPCSQGWLSWLQAQVAQSGFSRNPQPHLKLSTPGSTPLKANS